MQSLDNVLSEARTVEAIDGSPDYFPLANGRYEVKPGLMPFGVDLGNRADQQVFQIDDSKAEFRQFKLLARTERLSKYYQTCDYPPLVASAIAQLIVDRLTQEHPHYFHYQKGTINLHNQLTGETLIFDPQWQLQQVEGSILPPYASALDALAMQIQEDLAVVSRAADGSNWLSAIHVCYPNHWAAEEKIGKNFASVHQPVAGMEKINQRAAMIVNTMIDHRPTLRFGWGLSTDTRLNHHPQPPPDISDRQWYGRQFNPNNPRLYLRIERQVIWGLPEVNAALFVIRTYFRDCCLIKRDPRLQAKLIAAIASMTSDSLIYKGLADSKDHILAWLKQV